MGRLRQRARIPAVVRGAAWLAVAWIIGKQLVDGVIVDRWLWLGSRVWNALAHHDVLRSIADLAFRASRSYVTATYVLALGIATVATPLAFLARTLARGRIRAGLADPLEGLRRFVAARPRLTQALVATPSLVWFAFLMGRAHSSDPNGVFEGAWVVRSVYGLNAALCAAATFALSHAALRAFLAPTLEDVPAEASTAAKGDIVFDAVAVTRETRAAVAAMATLHPMVLALFLLPGFQTDRAAAIVFVAYAAIALGGAALFKKASRIAVGVDGVLVTGTSRTRFVAHRDVDDVRARGADIEILRRGELVLRLQLHGQDAARRAEIVTRIAEAIACARRAEGATAAQIVASASMSQLARAARGEGEYRAPALTRDQLWALVESPDADAQTRKTAAEALAAAGDIDRARLRVAASQLANPKLRVAIEALTEDDPDAQEVPLRTRALARKS